jgi:hypothetical protein
VGRISLVRACGFHGRVAKHTKRDPTLEFGPVLPHGEAVAKLPQGQATAQAADEERGVGGQRLPLAGLRLLESAQHAAQGLAEQDAPACHRPCPRP